MRSNGRTRSAGCTAGAKNSRHVWLIDCCGPGDLMVNPENVGILDLRSPDSCNPVDAWFCGIDNEEDCGFTLELNSNLSAYIYLLIEDTKYIVPTCVLFIMSNT